MTITIPELSLVVMIGISGSGKSSFARRHFKATEVLSSDYCRGLVSDDENDQSATKDAFEVLRFIAEKRLAAGRLTVIDATNVQPESRKQLVEIARKFHCLPVAIILDVPIRVCEERNRSRGDRTFGAHVLVNQRAQLKRGLGGIRREGFRHSFVLQSEEEIAAASIVRQPLWNNRKHDHGPFDIIGDVHGCCDELEALLRKLGYEIEKREDAPFGISVAAPATRKVIFLGDLVDRGPRIVDSLRLVMSMVQSGLAICVPGNHDIKLLRKLRGKNVQIKHGLAESLAEMEIESAEFRSQVVAFIDGLVSHYVLDGGKLVVAHAGMKESMQGRGSGAVRDFALFGETTGETDEFGLPVRYPWAQDYRGRSMVVYGHTPVPEPEWINRTINIDTGCVFGGKLTALRYPEREIVSVPAQREYAAPVRPVVIATVPPRADDALHIDDVLGKRVVATRLRSNITVREENAAAALETMSRFAIDPRWLIYLPPTMSPSETSSEPDMLERPAEAFAYFRKEGVERVICQEKHMGSRAVVVLCRDASVAERRFRMAKPSMGVCYTRTGRSFFDDVTTEQAVLTRVSAAAERAGLWDELESDWMCIDCELMPWSAKAQALLQNQYAPVGAASRAALSSSVELLNAAIARGVDLSDSAAKSDSPDLRERTISRRSMCEAYEKAYRKYCWTVSSIDDLKLAPFHLIASEGCVHSDKNHEIHMLWAERLAKADAENNARPLMMATSYRTVALANPDELSSAIAWWEALTSNGGEGMVVKPMDFVTKGPRGLVQPALKCRGREYLRIIYGPEYTAPENLQRLRARGLSGKRSLAIREFALGIEGLERFVQREPLYRVHECVFAVLAMESEPVDPRL